MDSKVLKKANKFFKTHKLYKFKKGENLIVPDNNPQGSFFLKEGMVRQYSTSVSGEEFVVNIFVAPSFFPLGWIFNNKIPAHYYEAMSKGEVWVAPKEQFLYFLKKNPDVLVDLIRRIYLGLEGFELRLESMMTGSAYKRLIVELLIDAKRFGSKGKESVKLRLTQDELAAESGIARETVSREMKKLRNNGLIQVQRHSLIVTSVDKLERELLSPF